MALTPSLQITQNNGISSSFVVTDSSTGSDPAITSRRLYLFTASNNTLVPEGTSTSYIEWPLIDGPITLNVLNRDYALMIVGNWMDGNTVLYTYTNYYQFPAHTKTFLFGLSANQSAQVINPNILTSTNFFLNKATLWSLVKDAANAIEFGQDIKKAQIAFDMAYNIILNEDKYF